MRDLPARPYTAAMRHCNLLVIALLALCLGAAPPVDVTNARFGGVGDGVHDDTAAIQAALDAARAGGGGAVFVPAGTYLVTADLSIGGKTSLNGAGPGVSIIRRKRS